MTLRDLLPDDVPLDLSAAGIEITGLSADSRTLRPGELFFALPGAKLDGLAFVPDAAEKGAAAIVVQAGESPVPTVGIPVIHAPNARQVLARAAARFYARQPATIAAVTGTSGKTSVAAFVRQIWKLLGHAAASIGTVGIVSPTEESYGSLTTPDPIALHATLARLAAEGVTHLAIEASSHGLHQHRLDGLRVEVGAYTNLSRDHLDYHPSMENYFAAKLRLFTELVVPGGGAVVNVDDAYGPRVADAAHTRGLHALRVGRQGEGIALLGAETRGFEQQLHIGYGGKDYRFPLRLVGAFQVENALIAAGIAIASGDDPDAVFPALGFLKGAKGRLELVGHRGEAPVFVDYAHKPDALAKALEALRPYARRRLVVVFGCGGDRDRGKRALMGKIAAERATDVIVTDDNPRSEEPAAIRAAILEAAPGAREIGDRAAAIREAVGALEAGDVLLIAGKGHESGQIVGDRVLPFSDHDAVAAALGEEAA